MKKTLIVAILVNFSFSLCFASDQNKFEQANALYDQEMYLQAAELYEELLESEVAAPEIYYNLGNAYFKADQLAHAILNYERALDLKCDFRDAKYNLNFANTKTIDEIIDTKDFFLKSWFIEMMYSNSSNRWFIISWGSFITFLIFTLFFLFSKKISPRKTCFSIALFSFILMSLTLVFSNAQKKDFLDRNKAIVMKSVITVKSSPGQGSTNLFELHEGTRVIIKTSINEWSEITIADQRTGWVESYQIEKI